MAAAAGPLLQSLVTEAGHGIEVGRDELLEEPGVPGGVDLRVRVSAQRADTRLAGG